MASEETAKTEIGPRTQIRIILTEDRKWRWEIHPDDGGSISQHKYFDTPEGALAAAMKAVIVSPAN